MDLPYDSNRKVIVNRGRSRQVAGTFHTRVIISLATYSPSLLYKRVRSTSSRLWNVSIQLLAYIFISQKKIVTLTKPHLLKPDLSKIRGAWKI